MVTCSIVFFNTHVFFIIVVVGLSLVVLCAVHLGRCAVARAERLEEKRIGLLLQKIES
jgi:hypothetical protein